MLVGKLVEMKLVGNTEAYGFLLETGEGEIAVTPETS